MKTITEVSEHQQLSPEDEVYERLLEIVEES